MYTASAKLSFHIPQANSLKDKRQVCRSLIDKTKRRYNVSIAEVDMQDVHQRLCIGIAVVSGENSHAEKSLDGIIRYMEEHSNADLYDIEIQ